MIPIKDNIPTSRFPILTVLLIAANLVVFGWQLHFSSSDYSNPQFSELGVSEQDQSTLSTERSRTGSRTRARTAPSG